MKIMSTYHVNLYLIKRQINECFIKSWSIKSYPTTIASVIKVITVLLLKRIRQATYSSQIDSKPVLWRNSGNTQNKVLLNILMITRCFKFVPKWTENFWRWAYNITDPFRKWVWLPYIILAVIVNVPFNLYPWKEFLQVRETMVVGKFL